MIDREPIPEDTLEELRLAATVALAKYIGASVHTKEILTGNDPRQCVIGHDDLTSYVAGIAPEVIVNANSIADILSSVDEALSPYEFINEQGR